MCRVSTRTYEVEWSASFVDQASDPSSDASSSLSAAATVSPSVPSLSLLGGVGLSREAWFMEPSEADTQGSAHQLYLALTSPFAARVALLAIEVALTPLEALLSAQRPSIHPVGPLPKNSPLRQWAWVQAAPSSAKNKRQLPTKKGAKPGQIGAPTSHNLVFHTRIKSSGYGAAPGGPVSKGSAPPRQLQLGGLHQKGNTTAGKMNQQALQQQQQRRAGSASASSSSASSDPPRSYPMDCGPICTYSPHNPAPGKAPPLHNGPITSLAFSPDARRLLSASMDSTACVLRVPPWKHPQGAAHLLGHKRPVRAAAWAWAKPGSGSGGAGSSGNSKDGDAMVLTSSSDATARLWQLGRAEPLLVFDHLKRNEAAVGAGSASASASASTAAAADINPLFTAEIPCCSFFRQNQLVLLAHRNQLLVYKFHIDPARTNTDLKKLQNLNKYKLLSAFTSDLAQGITTFACANSFLSTLVIVADSARHLQLVDLAVGRAVRTVADAHAKPVHAVALSAPSPFADLGEHALDSQQLFATAAADSAIKLWDVRTKESETEREMRGREHSGCVEACVAAAGGNVHFAGLTRTAETGTARLILRSPCVCLRSCFSFFSSLLSSSC